MLSFRAFVHNALSASKSCCLENHTCSSTPRFTRKSHLRQQTYLQVSHNFKLCLCCPKNRIISPSSQDVLSLPKKLPSLAFGNHNEWCSCNKYSAQNYRTPNGISRLCGCHYGLGPARISSFVQHIGGGASRFCLPPSEVVFTSAKVIPTVLSYLKYNPKSPRGRRADLDRLFVVGHFLGGALISTAIVPGHKSNAWSFSL